MSEASSSKAKINGFTMLPIVYPGKVIHNLYIRKHEAQKGTSASHRSLPEGRTLFLVNIPPDATTRDISQVFAPCGVVETVLFGYTGTRLGGDAAEAAKPYDEQEDTLMEKAPEAESDDSEMDDHEPGAKIARRKHADVEAAKSKPPHITPLPTTDLRQLRTTGHTAHVIFLERASISQALSLPMTAKHGRVKWPTPTASDPPIGLAHYIAQYDSLRPSLDIVKEHVDSSMAAYDFIQSQTAAARARETDEAILDDDGFTLVTRGGGRKGKAAGGGVGVVTKDFQLAVQQGVQNDTSIKLTKHLKKIQKADFYKFQVREKKKAEFTELRKKFEEDKIKINKLKANRKFRPY
ncbi:Ribosomal RNA-processing protein 7 [Tulasnella sp. JGI-2019a]|nr:Ribosomal RNA-processing protein 7 [Tulasnella sp. JGI-2019a]KAG9017455.1 Ribosomal RNA-processing protein 7 [Tulasnella sp. JGI-2019a]